MRTSVNGLPRSEEERIVLAEAMLHPRTDSAAHLNARWRWLNAGYLFNASSWDRSMGDGTYGRLCHAYAWGAHRLEHEGAIDPADLEIIEAHQAMPIYSASMRDDDVDFTTPRDRLKAALQAPLNKTEPSLIEA